eukprot:TRINITY_DN6310_c0_g1_i1.p1 TRINITY_DN6310_c0_g1~~TRINITY_DN6310_c0_g1_i1.p1  ORF type:complete len:288 (+),score=40.55 TRINITY_DN6310_c0_g1_i1:197-1060(+)
MGPSDAKETILFLHGFPDTRHTFFRQLSFFAEAGYRVIAPTLPGYELSCVPSSYHIANIARVVVAWIDALKQNRVHIVGHDWGAVITYVACNLAPHRFYSAVTVAIPHLRHFKTRLHLLPSQVVNSWYMILFQFRFFAEWCVQRDKCAFIDKLWVDWSPDHPTYTLEVKRLFRNKAILKNALAYYRALPDMFSSAGRETERLSGAPLRVPCLAVTGARDGCMDTRLHDMLMDPQCFSAPYRIKRLAQSGHFAHQEEWQVFNRWVLEWIQRYSRTYLESGEAPSSSTL